MDIDAITEMLKNTRERPKYITTVLEFKLGRKPTQEEIDSVRNDAQLKRIVYEGWLASQPWYIRKHHVEKEQRIRIVLMKRYNVPESLIAFFTNEIEEKYREY